MEVEGFGSFGNWRLNRAFRQRQHQQRRRQPLCKLGLNWNGEQGCHFVIVFFASKLIEIWNEIIFVGHSEAIWYIYFKKVLNKMATLTLLRPSFKPFERNERETHSIQTSSSDRKRTLQVSPPPPPSVSPFMQICFSIENLPEKMGKPGCAEKTGELRRGERILRIHQGWLAKETEETEEAKFSFNFRRGDIWDCAIKADYPQ